MLSGPGSGGHQQQLQIIQDEKFYMRLLSKETSAANPSFRVYYGVAAGSVPFRWESQPGTPKHAVKATTLPPLNPPPSFYSMSPTKKSLTTRSSKNKLIHAILPRLITQRKPHSPSPPLSSSSSSLTSRDGYEEFKGGFSPTSTLCFRESRRTGGKAGGCYSMGLMKNYLLSIVGRGSDN